MNKFVTLLIEGVHRFAMKTLIQSAFGMLLFYSLPVGAQNSSISGVYAGLQTMMSMIGGGLARIDHAVLLRADGTYNDDLRKADWQSYVTGKYTVIGRTVTLLKTGNTVPVKYTVDKEGNLDAGGYSLVKQLVDGSVPKGDYEFSSGGSAGGNGSVFISTATDKNLYFDGKGNFSGSSASASSVSGANVGGGKSSNSSGSGTYRISKGVLTLTYGNGAKVVHSFFCRPGYDPVMAVIDGRIFFMDEKKSTALVKTSPEAETTEQDTQNSSPTGTEMADAKTILLKANAAHGGAALDGIKRVSFAATSQGVQIKGFIDIPGNRLRMEVHQGSKLVQIEQVEGKAGWQWREGKVSELAADRIEEIQSPLYSGLLGLRKVIINASQLSIQQTAQGYILTGEYKGKQYAIAIDRQWRMMASADQAGATPTTTTYSDFRTISGVLVAFGEVNKIDGQSVPVQYQTFTIDPDLPASTWSKP